MSLFGDDPEETFGYDNGGMSEYQQVLQQERQDRLLKQQIRKHGEDAMQATPVAPLGSGVESEPFARSYVIKMPGESVENFSERRNETCCETAAQNDLNSLVD